MGDLPWALLAMAGLVALLWLTTRIEPHWVSRDGRRMLATAQLLDRRGMPAGRRFDARVVVTPDDTILVRRRALVRRTQTAWRVDGCSPDPPARRQIYVLRPAHDDQVELLTLRLPATSRAVAVLDGLMRGAAATPGGRPGTWRSGRRADPG